jgi:hypothetical protein
MHALHQACLYMTAPQKQRLRMMRDLVGHASTEMYRWHTGCGTKNSTCGLLLPPSCWRCSGPPAPAALMKRPFPQVQNPLAVQ